MRAHSRVHVGDCRDVLRTMAPESVHCIVTSPPYFLARDYAVSGQVGLETHIDEYVAALVNVFAEARRVLRDDGTLWLNVGDSFYCKANVQRSIVGCFDEKTKLRGVRVPATTLKEKDLIGVPWRVALALQADGWYLRSDIIWHKPNPMPTSIKDRPTPSHEYVFLLTKSSRYYYDGDAIAEPVAGRQSGTGSFKRSAQITRTARGGDGWAVSTTKNRRSVWTIAPTARRSGSHIAMFPERLAELCILAGCPERGTVLDPFIGSGTTAVVALANNRSCVGIELNPAYAAEAEERIRASQGQDRLEVFSDAA